MLPSFNGGFQLKINTQDYILYMGSSSTRLHNVISCFIIFDYMNMNSFYPRMIKNP